MSYRNGYLRIHIRIHIASLFRAFLGVILILYLAVTAIHLSNGLGIGRAVQGAFIDARVAVSCPNKPQLVWDFVNRNYLLDYGLQLGAFYGISPEELCQHDSLDELR